MLKRLVCTAFKISLYQTTSIFPLKSADDSATRHAFFVHFCYTNREQREHLGIAADESAGVVDARFFMSKRTALFQSSWLPALYLAVHKMTVSDEAALSRLWKAVPPASSIASSRSM